MEVILRAKTFKPIITKKKAKREIRSGRGGRGCAEVKTGGLSFGGQVAAGSATLDGAACS
jgi:hypothetical protein